MSGFERDDVIFEHAAKPHNFQGMGAQRFLVVVTQGDKEKEPREESNDHDPDGGSGKEFEVKMLGAEKPGGAAAKETSTTGRFLGYVDLRHYKFQKSK